MNLFYFLKIFIYVEGVINGVINIDIKEKFVLIILF